MPKIYTTETFVEKAKSIHGKLYSYENTRYKSSHQKIEIICYIHGSFFKTPNCHLSEKAGCPICQKIKPKNVKTKTKTNFEFITKANIIHNNYFDYNKSVYIKSSIKIIITCPVHGDFEQLPADHLRGYGCIKCGKQKLIKPLTTFIEEANKMHENKYIYTKSIYNGSFEKIEIICPFHGIFLQSPKDHLCGSGCQKCGSNSSVSENKWLNIFNIPLENRRFFIKLDCHIFYFDGYDPTTNTVYEFYGDYWHGNPNKYMSNDLNKNNHKTFGELYQNTIIRENIIKKYGFKLITIWESDFNGKKNV